MHQLMALFSKNKAFIQLQGLGTHLKGLFNSFLIVPFFMVFLLVNILLFTPHNTVEADICYETKAVVLHRSSIDRSILVRVIKSDAYEPNTYITFEDVHYGDAFNGIFEEISKTDSVSEGDIVLIQHRGDSLHDDRAGIYKLEILSDG